jgi:hypothetical protein
VQDEKIVKIEMGCKNEVVANVNGKSARYGDWVASAEPDDIHTFTVTAWLVVTLQMLAHRATQDSTDTSLGAVLEIPRYIARLAQYAQAS